MKDLLPLALLFSGISPACALDVGDISSFMNSDSSTLSKHPKQHIDSGRLINIHTLNGSSPLLTTAGYRNGQAGMSYSHSASLLLPAPSQRSDPLLVKGPQMKRELLLHCLV